MSKPTQSTTLTLTPDQIAQLDAEARRLEAETRIHVSRSAVARRLLDEGLVRLSNRGGGGEE